jgi:hypothetical protein
LDFIARGLIVAPDFNLLAQFPKILDQVVSKGIVVVQHKDHVKEHQPETVYRKIHLQRNSRWLCRKFVAEGPPARVNVAEPTQLPNCSPLLVALKFELPRTRNNLGSLTIEQLESKRPDLLGSHSLGNDWRGPMTQSQLERRSHRRFALDLPVAVKFLDDGTYEVTGRTRDVSSRGAFFYLNSEIREGASIDFVMTLPSEITLTEPIRVQCSGTVVRVDRTAEMQGVAVSIDKYDFVRDV